MKCVLLVGSGSDAHVIAVADELRRIGSLPIVFDIHNQSHFITLSVLNGSTGGHFTIDRQRFDFDRFSAVWWRLKPVLPAEYNGVPASTDEAFVVRERRATVKSLGSYLRQQFWVNPIDRQERVASKPYQLALASRIGLSVPDTFVTNEPSTAETLFCLHQRAIYKVVHWYFTVHGLNNENIGDTFGETIYTTEITKSDIRKHAENIKKAPCQFQELLSKSHELRVNIVGDTIWTVRINSQGMQETRMDWRHAQLADIFEKGKLESEVERKLLDFHKEAGLISAAYDLVQTPDGETVFLECNPGGQWLWLEHRLDIPITRRLAETLHVGATTNHAELE